MKYPLFLASFVCPLALSACFSSPVNPSSSKQSTLPLSSSNMLPAYPYTFPNLSMPAEPELRALTSESGASTLIQKVGTVFAYSSSSSKYLDGYKSPQYGLMINGFHSKDHLAGICYEVMNDSVQKARNNTFYVSYSFISHSSDETDQRSIGFVKLNDIWCLKFNKKDRNVIA